MYRHFALLLCLVLLLPACGPDTSATPGVTSAAVEHLRMSAGPQASGATQTMESAVAPTAGDLTDVVHITWLSSDGDSQGMQQRLDTLQKVLE